MYIHINNEKKKKDWKETGPNVKTYLFGVVGLWINDTLFFTLFCTFHNRNITLIIRFKKKNK